LFDALHGFFQNQTQQGWRYSVDALGEPLDERQDLYTHAFIVYACAAYFRRSQDSLVRRLMLQTAEGIEVRFKRPDSLYNVVLSADWQLTLAGPIQNLISNCGASV
jgi:mannose/cellobiose epimerase-like protein (N-acyl-D-glucosamine 2-epimerase family)